MLTLNEMTLGYARCHVASKDRTEPYVIIGSEEDVIMPSSAKMTTKTLVSEPHIKTQKIEKSLSVTSEEDEVCSEVLQIMKTTKIVPTEVKNGINYIINTDAGLIEFTKTQEPGKKHASYAIYINGKDSGFSNKYYGKFLAAMKKVG